MRVCASAPPHPPTLTLQSSRKGQARASSTGRAAHLLVYLLHRLRRVLHHPVGLAQGLKRGTHLGARVWCGVAGVGVRGGACAAQTHTHTHTHHLNCCAHTLTLCAEACARTHARTHARTQTHTQTPCPGTPASRSAPGQSPRAAQPPPGSPVRCACATGGAARQRQVWVGWTGQSGPPCAQARATHTPHHINTALPFARRTHLSSSCATHQPCAQPA
jgi:hypothetical protein